MSYKHDVQPDVRLANAVSKRLSADQHDVFIDSKIALGDEWPKVIGEQLTASEYLIVFLSEAATASEMVIEEVAIARRVRNKQGKPKILPVRIANEAPFPYDLGAWLDRIQSAFWRTDADDAVIVDHLASAVGNKLEKAAVGTAASALATDGNAVAQGTKIVTPLPSFDPRWLEQLDAPGGSVRLSSPFYVQRSLDTDAAQALSQPGVTLLLNGGRQTGKSSVLARLFQHARDKGRPAVFIDFQRLDSAQLGDLNSLLRYIADVLAIKLKTNANAQGYWSTPLGPIDKLTSFVEGEILDHAVAPVVLLMDEVDRVFGHPCCDDFFGLLRSWHNSRAFDPLWEQLDLVLAYSTEASLLIGDQNQSPFNVGHPLETSDFTLEEVLLLNQKHGSPLKKDTEIDGLMELLAGHPFLTRKALYELVKRPMTFAALRSCAAYDDGPFADHLHRYLVVVGENSDHQAVFKAALSTGMCETDKAFHALRSAGLIRGHSRLAVQPRCELYWRYFKDRL